MPIFIRNGKIQTDGVSLVTANHCNLRCADCCALSSYQSPSYPSVSKVAADLTRLSTVLHATELRLIGGEPLLNPKLGELTRLARQSGIADRVTIFTNGMLLDRMDELTWRNLDQISVSIYPKTPPPAAALARAEARAREDGISMRLYRRPSFETRVVNIPHPLDLTTALIYRTCRAAHHDYCARLHDGRLYMCFVPPALPEYLRRLGRDDYLPERDGVQVHEASDLFGDVKDYLLSPKPLDACRYCLGSVGRKRAHRQMTAQEVANPAAPAITRATHLSPTRLASHLAGHLCHMAANRLRGALD